MRKWLIARAKPFIDGFPRVAAMYRSVRDQLDFMEEPRQTRWGFLLAGNSAMADGTFEPIETEFIRKILVDVDVLVNVGANIGYYCCHALSMGKEVIAFEPIERNVRYLCKNMRANKWSGAEIYPIALSNRVGLLEMYGGNTGASVIKGWAGIPETYVTLVPSSTMDVVIGSRLRGRRTLILIDVEGAEKEVLEGARSILASDPRPIWIVEIVAKAHQPQDVRMNPNFYDTFRLFFENGYQSFALDGNTDRIAPEQVELAAQGRFIFNTHNFVFTDANRSRRLEDVF